MNCVPAHFPSTASKYSSNYARSRPASVSPDSLKHGLEVSTIIACKFISPNLLDHGLQVSLQTRLITISECIPMFTRSRPPGVSRNPLDYRLPVNLRSHLITASEYISGVTRSLFSGAPRIPLKHRLQPVQM